MNRFDQIPEELKELFNQKAEKIELEIGQVFCDFDSNPRGLLHIKKGDLRLIYTTEIYIICLGQLLGRHIIRLNMDCMITKIMEMSEELSLSLMVIMEI